MYTFLVWLLSLSIIIFCVCSVAQSCPTLCDPMDCNPPGSSVHGIFQARTMEQVAISFSSQPRDQICISCISWLVGGFFAIAPPGKAHNYFEIHNIVACTISSFLSRIVLAQQNCEWLYCNLYNYSLVDGYLGCFQFGAITNKAAINIYAKNFVGTVLSIFFDKYIGMGLLGHMVGYTFTCRPHGLQPLGSSVHGILQARILEGVAISFRGSSPHRNQTQVSCTAVRFFTN